MRAATLGGSIARAIAATLRDCGLDRAAVAKQMGEYLGQTVPKTMLDACASQARETHDMSGARLVALMHVTQDFRLLQLLADQFGLAVVERQYLPKIEEALIAEQIEKLEKRRKTLRRVAP